MALIGDLLDYSSIESGRMQLLPQEVNPAEVAREAVAERRSAAVQKGLALNMEVAEDTLPGRVLLDPLRLRQILLHLLDNAIKFTDAGTITLRLDRNHCGGEPDCLHILVEDTGMGMSGDVLSTLFQPFHQADASSTRRHGGIGLGLALCARLAGLMGGRIWAESTPGVGSRLHLKLRFRLPESPVAARDRVLLVTANVMTGRLLHSLLSKAGWRVDTVAAMQEAARVMGQGGHAAAFIDIHLPGLDGKTPSTRWCGATPPPLVALAGNEEERALCLEAGFRDCLMQPYDLASLKRVLDSALLPLPQDG
jgi:CheY-like chemotaxis protein